MFKIFQIMNKISKFSNQMTELTSSADYTIEERKNTPKKKKSQKITTKPEILGFDYKQIGDRMLNQSGKNDEMKKLPSGCWSPKRKFENHTHL